MANSAIIEEIEKEQLKELPDFRIGDTIRVSIRIVEGEKERTQMFQGTVIARKGKSLSETFSLHRISYGEGMERVFYLHSPRIVKIEIIKRGDVRRAKLYYLRGTSGKASKIQEKIVSRRKAAPSSKGSVAQRDGASVDSANHMTQTETDYTAAESVVQGATE